MAEFVTLRPGDEAALDGFLAQHADNSMFLRSNARAAGLEDHGEPFQATYVAAREQGAIMAVAAHCWNGILVLQAPVHLGAVARAAVQRSGRGLVGLAGPGEQVIAARAALALGGAPATKAGAESLYALDLAELRVPEPLRSGRLSYRHSAAEELDLLTEWRVAFGREALGLGDDAETRAAARGDVSRGHRQESDWVLLEDGRPVAYAVFNARLPDIVQLGGVWTTPELRGRGYGRSVVAAALLAARDAGVRRAVLFADDPAACRAYEAIGFRRVGDYGLVIFAEPLALGG